MKEFIAEYGGVIIVCVFGISLFVSFVNILNYVSANL